MNALTLERKNQEMKGDLGSGVVITPPVGGTYWSYRVQLSETQAMLGFPKFFVIGVGFDQEEDWNTNLPVSCEAEKIFDHIKHNKADDAISDEDCIAAIRLIQEAVLEDERNTDEHL